MFGGANRPHCRGGLLMTLGGLPVAASWRCWARAGAPRIVAPAPASAVRRDRRMVSAGIVFPPGCRHLTVVVHWRGIVAFAGAGVEPNLRDRMEVPPMP